MGHQEIGIVELEVEHRLGEDNTGYPSEEEHAQETNAKEHSAVYNESASPHGAYPVEELDSSRNHDEDRHSSEKWEKHRSGCVHVVCPDTHRKDSDR